MSLSRRSYVPPRPLPPPSRCPSPPWPAPAEAAADPRTACRSFALDDDDELAILPPLPEKEPIWRRANIHLSPNLEHRGRYSALEQRERLARPRPASYLELDMAAQQQEDDAGGSGEQEPPPERRRRPVAAVCWLLGALLVGATAATLYRVRRLSPREGACRPNPY